MKYNFQINGLHGKNSSLGLQSVFLLPIKTIDGG